jgi:hypothetical protein
MKRWTIITVCQVLSRSDAEIVPSARLQHGMTNPYLRIGA